MHCLSTRGKAPAVPLAAAIAAGLAPDGGLYLPAQWPRFTTDDFAGLDALDAIAERLLRPFFADDALAAALPAICADAFAIAAPCKPLPMPHSWLLELFHGPTAAFKDYAARFLAGCLQSIECDPTRLLTVLVATSGDTGAAVAAACHGRPGLRVVILYPDGRVSPRQAHQLGAFGDNVRAFRVQGSFDDCQALAKQALLDPELNARLRLSSANSISLGRLLPQMAYYAQAALRHWRSHGRALGFVIPTGNLGNALAAVLVRRMGLPVAGIVLACNANDALPRYFAGADYQPRPSMATLANAMDVGAPSNFERLRALHADDAALRGALLAECVDDDAIREALRAAPALTGEILCPHSACALVALLRRRQHGDESDYALVATAHPAKFDQVLVPLLDALPPPPPELAALLARPSHAEPLRADFTALRSALLG